MVCSSDTVGLDDLPDRVLSPSLPSSAGPPGTVPPPDSDDAVAVERETPGRKPSSASERPSPFSWALCAGICLGLGTLTRSTGLFFPLILASAYILVAQKRKTSKPASLARRAA